MFKKLLAIGLVFIAGLTLSACTPKDTGPTTEEILTMISEAMDEVDLPSSTTTDLVLPTSGLHEVTITWESNNTAVIANDGTVTIPTKTMGNQTVTLTATLTLDDQELTKTFTITVNAAADYTNQELLDQAKASLVLTVTGIVTADISLPATGSNGTTITWVSSNTDVVANDGTVTRPANGDGNATVTLTATITLGTLTTTKEIEVVVAEEEPSTVFTSVATLVTSTLGDIVEFQGTVSGVFDGGYFLTDGTDVIGVYDAAFANAISPAIGDTVLVKGAYAKYYTLFQISDIQNETIVTQGDGTQPLTPTVISIADLLALDSSNPLIHGKLYTITGTVTLQGDYDNIYLVDGTDEVLIYYYSLADSLTALEAEVGKEVTITVIYYTDHPNNGVMMAFDGGAADITVSSLSDADALAADIAAAGADVPAAAVTDVTLPTEGPNGTQFTNWTSDNTAVFGNDGTFVARDTSTVMVTFTADATKGSETGTATIEVYVPVINTIGEVNALPLNSYFEITGTVYQDTYYGLFIWDGTDFIFVYDKDVRDATEPGDDVTIIGRLGAYNGLLQVNTVSYTLDAAANTYGAPTPVAGTVEGLVTNVYPMGQPVTITGTVSVEGDYDDVMIAGLTGAQVKVYYHSNADLIATMNDNGTPDDSSDDYADGYAGKTITLTVIPYNPGGLVLYYGDAAGISEETSWAPTDAEKAQIAADSIDLGDIDNVSMDLTLPADETTTSATITWATSDAAVVTDTGVVTLTYGNETMATLTATVTVGAETVTRDFMITVVDGNSLAPMSVADAKLEADGDMVVVEGIVAGFNEYGDIYLQDNDTGASILIYYTSFDAALGDKIVVSGELATYSGNDNDKRELTSANLVEIVDHDNTVYITTDVDAATLGVLTTVGTYQSRRFTMDLTVSSLDDGHGYIIFVGDGTTSIKFKQSFAPYFGGVYAVDDVISVTFSVYGVDYSDIRVDDVVLPDLTDAQKLMAAEYVLDLPASTTTDLTLPADMTDYSATITWASSNTNVITDAGVVTQPGIGEADAVVTMTATITVGSETPVDVTFDVTVPALQAAPTPELFFSEYAEANGGSCKYVEIYNPTGATVDLTAYKIIKGGNGTAYADSSDILTLTGTLASGAVLVIGNSACQSSSDPAQDPTVSDPLFPTTGIDWVASTVVGYVNGDDALGLFKNDVLIDTIGLNGEDPGSSWGVGNGNTTDGTTADVILVRVASVVAGSDDWTVAATQWIVQADDRDYSTVGTHTCDAPSS